MTKAEFMDAVDHLGRLMKPHPLWVLTQGDPGLIVFAGLKWTHTQGWRECGDVPHQLVYMQVYDQAWIGAFGSLTGGPGASVRGGMRMVRACFDTYEEAADALVSCVEAVSRGAPNEVVH